MEFEPIKKEKHVSFLFKNIYILVLGLIILLGTSYSLNFLENTNKNNHINISVGGLNTLISNQNINSSNMKPTKDNLGLMAYKKDLVIQNTSSLNGIVELSLMRLSGLSFDNLRYGLYINDVLVKVANLQEDGLLYTYSILGNETINIRLSLWIKEDYLGLDDTFVGIIIPNIQLDTILATTYLDDMLKDNKIVSLENNLFKIKEIKDGRLVLTGDITSFSNNHKLIVDIDEDNKTISLKKTTKIIHGNGTIDNPYILDNYLERIEDRKILGYITYVDELVATNFVQPIYEGYDNYISEDINDPTFLGWSSVMNKEIEYYLGDKINITSDIILYAIRRMGW